MSDVFSTEKRSEVMRAIKSKNTGDILCAALMGLWFLLLIFLAVRDLLGFRS